MFELIATLCFGLAVCHTFFVKRFQTLALSFKPGSVGENLFHLLGEIEVVFGVWAAIFSVIMTIMFGKTPILTYLSGLSFSEPLFVCMVMIVSATKPVMTTAKWILKKTASLLPFSFSVSYYMVLLILGPLLGSFITEPAAMTVVAALLYTDFYSKKLSTELKYATLGLLFVTISIGGTLTHFAAPPVVMVASTWGWDMSFMFMNFGWKALIAIVFSVLSVVVFFRKELSELPVENQHTSLETPVWMAVLHAVFLVGIIALSHYSVVCVMVFLLFLGVYQVTQEYQSELKIKEGLLVGFFLGGLVIFGGLQKWWLEPLLSQMRSGTLFFGSIGLTAITDNAALTYLGSQLPSLTDSAKYALVSGSVVGGGLTVIANAPNPIGFSVLNPAFGEKGISPLGLFFAALHPTLIAALCLGCL